VEEQSGRPAAHREPVRERCGGARWEGHQALLVALPPHAPHAPLGVPGVDGERGDLGAAQPAAVEDGEERAVARPQRPRVAPARREERRQLAAGGRPPGREARPADARDVADAREVLGRHEPEAPGRARHAAERRQREVRRRGRQRALHINFSEAEVAALALPPRRGEGLRVREVAERMGRTPGTVRQWLHDGKLPVRVGVGEHPQGRYYDIVPEALVPRDAVRSGVRVHDAAELAVPDRAALEGVMRELYSPRGILVDLVDDPLRGTRPAKRGEAPPRRRPGAWRGEGRNHRRASSGARTKQQGDAGAGVDADATRACPNPRRGYFRPGLVGAVPGLLTR